MVSRGALSSHTPPTVQWSYHYGGPASSKPQYKGPHSSSGSSKIPPVQRPSPIPSKSSIPNPQTGIPLPRTKAQKGSPRMSDSRGSIPRPSLIASRLPAPHSQFEKRKPDKEPAQGFKLKSQKSGGTAGNSGSYKRIPVAIVRAESTGVIQEELPGSVSDRKLVFELPSSTRHPKPPNNTPKNTLHATSDKPRRRSKLPFSPPPPILAPAPPSTAKFSKPQSSPVPSRQAPKYELHSKQKEPEKVSEKAGVRNERKKNGERNWVLTDKGPALPSAQVNVSSVSVMRITSEEKRRSSLRSPHKPIPPLSGTFSTFRSKQLTQGRLGLTKSSSLGEFLGEEPLGDGVFLPHRQEPLRTPLSNVFPPPSQPPVSSSRRNDSSCCHCADACGSSKPLVHSTRSDRNLGRLDHVPPIIVQSSGHRSQPSKPEPIDLRFHDETSHDPRSRRNGIDIGQGFKGDGDNTSPRSSDSKESPTSASESWDAAPNKNFTSCPDLLRPCMDSSWDNSQRVRTMDGRRRGRRGRRKAEEWAGKEVEEWTLDDILLWLQHLKLDTVASVLIGYDICGKDVVEWDEESLTDLGITDPETQDILLSELHAFQPRKMEKPKVKPWKSERVPLFNLVRASSYDQILAVEFQLGRRDIVVAEGAEGALTVTRTSPFLPLEEGDCILEMNNQPVQWMPAVDFTKRLAEQEGQGLRLVVLRRKEQRSASAPLRHSPTPPSTPSEHDHHHWDSQILHF